MNQKLLILGVAAALFIPTAPAQQAQAKDRYCGNFQRFEQITTTRVSCHYAKKFIRRGDFWVDADFGYFTQPPAWDCDLKDYGDEGAVEWLCWKRKRVIDFVDPLLVVTKDNLQPDPYP